MSSINTNITEIKKIIFQITIIFYNFDLINYEQSRLTDRNIIKCYLENFR